LTIDYRQLYPKIRQLCDQVEQGAIHQRGRCQKAIETLERYQTDIEYLQQCVEKALVQEGKTLRCAKPLDDPLQVTYPLPGLENRFNLAASDGSQILPDRHAELFFGLINVGGLSLSPNAAASPTEYSQSEFWYSSDNEDFNEAVFNFRRDVMERKLLLEISLRLEPPVLALTDGPLELWMEYRFPNEERVELKRLLQCYLSTLETFQERGISLCGYVDRPESSYVVRLLELATAMSEGRGDLRRFRPFKGVMDGDLFGALLRPGERSALFALQSPLLEHLPPESAVCFFYLRVSSEIDSSLARVEIPLWLAREKPLVDQVHAAIIAQCRQSGAYAYPYLLHRAHEIAVVHPQDRETIIRSLLIELQRRGYPPAQLSHKQALKNLPLRKISHLE